MKRRHSQRGDRHGGGRGRGHDENDGHHAVYGDGPARRDRGATHALDPASHAQPHKRRADLSSWRRYWRVGTLALCVVVALLAWHLWPRDPYALPRSDWNLFKQRFLAADGRIVDDGNGGISHSEGQGYGMLLAVAFHDRQAFDLIWRWTLSRLKQKDDFLFSWQWLPSDGGKIGDVNNASDGDLLIAWALDRAFREWKDYDYLKASGQIVTSYLSRMTVDTWLGTQILPGAIGFQKPDGVVLNPSYYVFPAISEMGSAFHSPKWAAIYSGGIALLKASQFGNWKLAPDWVLVGAKWVALPPDHEPVFGYNAIRVPLNIAWDDPRSPLLNAYAEFWESLPPGTELPATVNLKTGQFGPYAALPGMIAVKELTLACAKSRTITVAEIPRLLTEETYYSASLKLLTKMAIRERFGPKMN